MHLVAGFESSSYVEIALEEMREQCNVTTDQVAFIEMKPEQRPQTFFDSIHYSDGSSSMDGIAVGAVIGGVFGIIYGSVMPSGSVVIGVLGFALGGGIGYAMDKYMGKRQQRKKSIRHIEMLLMIQCRSKEELNEVSDICRRNNVISLGVHR